MDHSIKRKTEKPKLVRTRSFKPAWACYCQEVMAVQPTGTAAYLLWKQIREEKGAKP